MTPVTLSPAEVGLLTMLLREEKLGHDPESAQIACDLLERIERDVCVECGMQVEERTFYTNIGFGRVKTDTALRHVTPSGRITNRTHNPEVAT